MSEDGRYTNSEFTFDALLDMSANIDVDPEAQEDDNQDGVSLTESIFNYQKENGRTYHAYRAGSYPFPNDQMENERLDNQHEILKILLNGRNYLAPWTKEHPPNKVLDVATGTGRWAVEMGDEFPTAEVIGIDLSPIQPTMVPPNVSFFVEDATEDWGEDDLDYIHTRITTGCWSDFYTDIVAKAFAHLQPGGWLECQELRHKIYCDDETLTKDMAMYRWGCDLAEAGERIQRPLAAAERLKEWFTAAGFVDVQEKLYKLPINGWPRDPRLKAIGEFWQRNLQNGLQAFSYGLMHRVLGHSKAAIEVSLVDVRKDIGNPQIHAYNLFCVVYGRKPETAGSVSPRSTSTTTPTPTLR